MKKVINFEGKSVDLASDVGGEEKSSIESISIDLIDIDSNVRSNYEQTSIKELADSIKKFGLLQPITVVANLTRFTILSGHRRYMACKLAGLNSIDCLIHISPANITERRSIQLVENIQRENLSPVDLELAVNDLLTSFSVKDVAKMLCKSVSWVNNCRSSVHVRSNLEPELQKDMAGVSSSNLAPFGTLPSDIINSVVKEAVDSGKLKTKANSKESKNKVKDKPRVVVKLAISSDGIYTVSSSVELDKKIEAQLRAILNKIESLIETNKL